MSTQGYVINISLRNSMPLTSNPMIPIMSATNPFKDCADPNLAYISIPARRSEKTK